MRSSVESIAVKQAWLVVTDAGPLIAGAEVRLPDPSPENPLGGDRAFLVRAGPSSGLVAVGSLAQGKQGWRCRLERVLVRRPLSRTVIAKDPVTGVAGLRLDGADGAWQTLGAMVGARLDVLVHQRMQPSLVGLRVETDGVLEVGDDVAIDIELQVAEVLAHPTLEFGVLLPDLNLARAFILAESQSNAVLERLKRAGIRGPADLARISPFRLGLRPGWGPKSVEKAAEIAVATAKLGR